jgi:hypothetical protein
VRWKGDDRLLVVSNFGEVPHKFQLKLDEQTLKSMHLTDGWYKLTDQLTNEKELVLEVKNGKGKVELALAGLESFILKMDVLSDTSE